MNHAARRGLEHRPDRHPREWWRTPPGLRTAAERKRGRLRHFPSATSITHTAPRSALPLVATPYHVVQVSNDPRPDRSSALAEAARPK